MLAFTLHAGSAQAQPARVFVAAQGLDTNPCTFAQPCRSFQKAHDTVVAGGEIDVLDPAGYGALTITKAISIQGHSFSGIIATSGDAIHIDAAATDVINLRGLIIEGAGTGVTGISFSSGALLNVQESVISRFGSNGVAFVPGGASKLLVSNTVVSDNGGRGILVGSGGAGPVTAMLNRSELSNNLGSGLGVSGLSGTGVMNVTVADSVMANNTIDGVDSFSSNGHAAVNIMLVRCVVFSNGSVGVLTSGPPVTLRSFQTAVTANATGWSKQNNSTFLTYGDNGVDGNTTEVLGAPTSLTTR